MINFTYYTPTEVVFGKGAEEKTAELVKKYGGTNVLIHYGGKSAERLGLIDKITKQFDNQGLKYTLLGGVVPNPRLSLVKKGIEVCKENDIDFILAIGGGSVIDSSKAIGYGLDYQGDVWDLFDNKGVAETSKPVGAILTIPAAGSEMSDSCVITNEDGDLKRGYNSNVCRCKFAVMNPEFTFTLPEFQTACGAVDIMMHTMERYFSPDTDMKLTDSIAEALMRTVKDSVFDVLKDPQDYNARAQLMWASSLAHNDLTGCGMKRDFATHRLEHELSAMFDVAHGAGLSALWSSWARYVMNCNIARFVQFAVNVAGVENIFADPKKTALKGIEVMERFYKAIKMPTTIPELLGRKLSDSEILEMAQKCSRNDTLTHGSFRVLKMQDMIEIYRMANN
ncbi:MAG: iron-containing alcohol dehydrogenase [Bacteroidales bacterium]|nr:iron-containing alcohol dehydrogenase [Bacteroidales bacterium]